MKNPLPTLFLFFTVFLLASSARAQIQADPQVLQLPAVGTWNGFNGHLNYVECLNRGSATASLTFDVRDSFGVSLGIRGASVPAKGTVHFDLNVFAITNSYGTFLLSSADAARSAVACWTAVYKLATSGAGKAVQYAFMLPVSNAKYGTYSGGFNSFNPDGGALPTYNWLSIYNPSTAIFSATVETYSVDGSSTGSFAVTNLAAGARQDYPLGHTSTTNGGQILGMYRIVPSSDRQAYGAFVTRYAPDSSAANFKFAIPLGAVGGGCSAQPIPISTMDPATNWLEVVNLAASSTTVTLDFRDNLGTALGSQVLSIPAQAQRHILVNSILGERNVGQVRLSCSSPDDSLAVQSVFYGRVSSSASTTEWAYASQSRGRFLTNGISLAAPLNSNLSMVNWVKSANVKSSGVTFAALVNSVSGATLDTQPLFLDSRRAVDLALNSALGASSIGTVELTSSTLDGELAGEVIRVFSHESGGLGYIMNVPAALTVPVTPVVELQTVVSAGQTTVPVSMTMAGDGSSRLFIVERRGLIRILSNGSILGSSFLDLQSIVTQTGGERGLLGLVFHPSYSSNGRFYVFYTDAAGDINIARYTVSGDPNIANAGSGQVLLTVPHSAFSNHNGGQLAFGPDGYLYIGIGDGGSQGDPNGNGQNLQVLLGKVLRIDVDSGSPYAIPADNPFNGSPSAQDEIFAYGFRNPWRFSFDSVTSRLFVADVGQSDYEEVDIVESGANHGWKIREGAHCFFPSSGCQTAGLVDPVAEYTHAEGSSIIGGSVYRGAAIAGLYGSYLFADFSSGKIWKLNETSSGSWARSDLISTSGLITAMSQDEAGEIYVVFIDGRVAKIVQQ